MPWWARLGRTYPWGGGRAECSETLGGNQGGRKYISLSRACRGYRPSCLASQSSTTVVGPTAVPLPTATTRNRCPFFVTA